MYFYKYYLRLFTACYDKSSGVYFNGLLNLSYTKEDESGKNNEIISYKVSSQFSGNLTTLHLLQMLKCINPKCSYQVV